MKPTKELGDAIRLLALVRLPFGRRNIHTLFGSGSCRGGELKRWDRSLGRAFRKNVYRAWPRVNFGRCTRGQPNALAAIRAWKRAMPDPAPPLRLYDNAGALIPYDHIFQRLQTARERVHRIAADDGAAVLREVTEALRVAECRRDYTDELDALCLSCHPFWPRFFVCPECDQVGLNRQQGRTLDCAWCNSRWERARRKRKAAKQQAALATLEEITQLQRDGVPHAEAVEVIRCRRGISPEEMLGLLADD